jgi:hypothetical protein
MADEPKRYPVLIVDDTRVCWLFPDGSHRGVTEADVKTLNDVIEFAFTIGQPVKIDGQ